MKRFVLLFFCAIFVAQPAFSSLNDEGDPCPRALTDVVGLVEEMRDGFFGEQQGSMSWDLLTFLQGFKDFHLEAARTLLRDLQVVLEYGRPDNRQAIRSALHEVERLVDVEEEILHWLMFTSSVVDQKDFRDLKAAVRQATQEFISESSSSRAVLWDAKVFLDRLRANACRYAGYCYSKFRTEFEEVSNVLPFGGPPMIFVSPGSSANVLLFKRDVSHAQPYALVRKGDVVKVRVGENFKEIEIQDFTAESTGKISIRGKAVVRGEETPQSIEAVLGSSFDIQVK